MGNVVSELAGLLSRAGRKEGRSNSMGNGRTDGNPKKRKTCTGPWQETAINGKKNSILATY